MKWVRILLGGILVFVLTVLVIGATLPKEHQVTRSVVIQQPADVIYRVITDYPAAPQWRSDIARVEALPARDGHEVWREVDQHGDGVAYETLERASSRRLVRRIVDEGLPYGGTWSFDLLPTEGGTEVRITEKGHVDNPVFRFISAVVIGHTSYMDSYLQSLGRKFGEDLQPVTVNR